MEKKLAVNDCSFVHLTLLHYLAKCRSRGLAVYNNEFIKKNHMEALHYHNF